MRVPVTIWPTRFTPDGLVERDAQGRARAGDELHACGVSLRDRGRASEKRPDYSGRCEQQLSPFHTDST